MTVAAAAPPLDALTPLAAALRYARRGWLVFPCDGKLPDGRLAPQGFQNSSTSDITVRAWWTANPKANIGVACGKQSGLFVVDVDPGKNGAGTLAALEEQHGPLPETPRARTGGGGLHVFFSYPKTGHLGNSAGRLGPGVDTRGQGGYVVVAPSLHPATGQPYAWLDGLGPAEVELAAVPDWLVELLTDKPEPRAVGPAQRIVHRDGTDAYARRAFEDEIDQLAHAPEGSRNHQLNSAAFSLGQLVGAGLLDEGQVISALEQTARHVGLSDHEIERTIESGLSAGRAEPRQIPEPSGRIRIVRGPESAGASQQPEPWDEPIPLGRGGTPPAFPLDALPAWLGDYAGALAEETQTPTDLAGVLVLPAIATAAQGRVDVEPRPGWREQVNLFNACVLPPATRKTAVFSDTSAPVAQFEAAEVDRLRDKVAEQNAMLAASKARVEHLTQAVAKAKTQEDAAEARNQLAEAAKELAQTQPAVLPRYVVDDVTPEKLASILAEQEGRLAVFAPEGGELFELMSGRYGNGANFGVFLKAHAGDTLRVDRHGRPAEMVERPALTIAMAVQPEVIAGLHAKAGFRGRGLLGRFLFSVPRPTVGSRRTDPRPVPDRVRQRYRENVTRLLAAFTDDGRPTPGKIRVVGGRHVLRFAPDAYALFNGFERELEPRLGEFGDLGHVADWAGKLAGAVARIAGLLHLAFNVEQADLCAGEITADEAAAAVDLGRYFLGHATIAFGLMGADPALEHARHLLSWIERHAIEAFTKRDLFEGVKGRLPKADDLDAPLRLLERHGYVREKPQPERVLPDGTKVRGRKPAAAFEVNPAVLNSANSANCASHRGGFDEEEKWTA